eukprot:Protomagalhaensia_wolfi_Nauph_80__3069@NODE_313_length_2810_cov_196_444605_g236_i0_p2_GENE_NODE_313_length_2810_cov_196_444605_g236_i0NODE_313_length_2810_cov_196_444605_g236_i0_p2_ORF_typecomplete_len171_score16_06Lactamase_B_2/PF12706_7/2_7e16Lactamase_B/PF00753_27/5_5e10Lactamase_B_6/PF16661_5/0_00018Lactamase_B_3/PF13483_6/0_0015_NODE_313_length_2810_cov_196_444605_g236_i062574
MGDLILIGTGPSCGLPQLCHILDSVGKQDTESTIGCSVCQEIFENPDKPDRRYNVGALLRTPSATVLIDMGKTCRQALLAVAKDQNIHCIDAVLLTHDHADAIGGLDDLREFKRPGRFGIPVIASESTIASVKQYFPWLVKEPGHQVNTNVGEAVSPCPLLLNRISSAAV